MVSLLLDDQDDYGPVVSDFVIWCDSVTCVYMCQKQQIFPVILGKKAFSRSPLSLTMKLLNLLTILSILGWWWILHWNSAKSVVFFSKRVSSNCTFSESSYLLMLHTPPWHFPTDVLYSVLTFSTICWWGSLSVSDKSKLQKPVNICSKINGQQQLSS